MNKENTYKGFRPFTFLYYIGVISMFLNLVRYILWSIDLKSSNSLPGVPFFMPNSAPSVGSDLSINSYLLFSIVYIIFYGVGIVGLIKLYPTLNLISKRNIFLSSISKNFKQSAKWLLTFALGTIASGFAYLLTIKSSAEIHDFLSTEVVSILVLSYLLFFLADVLQEGSVLKEENELTI